MYKNGNFGNWKTANKGKLCNPKSKYYLGRVFGGKVYVCNQEYKQGEASCLKQTIETDKEMYRQNFWTHQLECIAGLPRTVMISLSE